MDFREHMCSDDFHYETYAEVASKHGGTDPASKQKAILEAAFSVFPITSLKMWIELKSYQFDNDGDSLMANEVAKFCKSRRSRLPKH